ncbi:hypothetical protein [Micromonospora chersina]|uniref:hypothetical protein n=1 Tax=Micromonospora chersina TaxID=47854 RepID=UPI003722D9F9
MDLAVTALHPSVDDPAVTPEQIDLGLDRLAALITDASAGAVGTAVSARAAP